MKAVSVRELFNGDGDDQIAARIIMAQIYWDLASCTNQLHISLVPERMQQQNALARRRFVLSQPDGLLPKWITTDKQKNLIMQALQQQLNLYPPVASWIERAAMDNLNR